MKQMRYRSGRRPFAAVATLLAVEAACARPAPSLDVNGGIGATSDVARAAYRFTGAQRRELPVRGMSTWTAWAPRSTFAGQIVSTTSRD